MGIIYNLHHELVKNKENQKNKKNYYFKRVAKNKTCLCFFLKNNILKLKRSTNFFLL
jgi:hypothetical protein